MDKRTIILRVLSLGVQIASGCAHFEQPTMDPVYGVTPPVVLDLSETPPASPGIADTLAEGTLNLLGSFVRHTVTPREKEHRKRVVVVHAAPVVQPPPRILPQHKETKRIALAQPKPDRPKPVQHKPKKK